MYGFWRNTAKISTFERILFMKITLDLETKDITVPKNFFKIIEKENDVIKAYNGEPVSPVDRIKNAFNEAMADTDRHLHVKA